MNEVAQQLHQSLETANLRNRAMLASLTISVYQARKHDPEVSGKAASDHHAKSKAGRYNKMLIDRSYLEPINQLATQMRNEHYQLTLPWLDNGQRILTLAHYEKYCERMNALADEFHQAVDHFLDNYEQAKAEAKQYLGDMYREGDYLTKDQVRDKFACEFYMMPMPAAEDFRVGISDDDIERASHKLEQAIQQGQQEAWQRMIDCVEKIGERCRTYGRERRSQFRDSVVENLVEVMDLAPGLNLSDSNRMGELASQARQQLGSHTAAELREHEDLRNNVAAEADSILHKMRTAMQYE